MKMEQMGGFENNKGMIGNQMQMELAASYHQDLGDFIEQYAESFREIVDKNPNLLDAYITDPKKTLEEIKTRMQH
jgi:hypothetical protein